MGDDAAFWDDPLRVYLTELSRIPPLDRAEEIACIKHVRTGDEMAEVARKRLVEANLQLVVSLADAHRSNQIHILDLLMKGNEGLLRATQALADCADGAFSAHATKFIERALADAVASGATNT